MPRLQHSSMSRPRSLATDSSITRIADEPAAERLRRVESELRAARAEIESLRRRLESSETPMASATLSPDSRDFHEIIGQSAVMRAALSRVALVAPTDATVLILGETGSGKELFARAVHSRSKRRAARFVRVNCGTIPAGLVESELFGHVKGSFTGAVDNRVGRFQLAHGGTLLLDEVAELPLEAQVKLLRVLQERELEPVGSGQTQHVDVRVIAATHCNLEQAVRAGRFRADLLYRLDVVPITVPALRDRPEDVPQLLAAFVAVQRKRLGKPLRGFSRRSLQLIAQHSWPGNIRELENLVERAAVLATSPVLEVAGLLEPAASDHTSHTSMDAVQRAHIEGVLLTTRGVVEGRQGAAEILGMHPNTLRSRMKKLGIHYSVRKMAVR